MKMMKLFGCKAYMGFPVWLRDRTRIEHDSSSVSVKTRGVYRNGEGELVRLQLDIPADGSAKLLICGKRKNIFLNLHESSFHRFKFHGGSTSKNFLVLIRSII